MQNQLKVTKSSIFITKRIQNGVKNDKNNKKSTTGRKSGKKIFSKAKTALFYSKKAAKICGFLFKKM